MKLSGGSDIQRTQGSPPDRLTRIAGDLAGALEQHVERQDGDKVIVFADDGQRGGICMHGYSDDIEAMADLFSHLRAMFRANGKDLQFYALGGDGNLTADVQ
jgi:hypothetical protein